MIPYKCTKCGADIQSPSELAGQSQACPGCGTTFVVPPLHISGWLVLPAIGMIAGPFRKLSDIGLLMAWFDYAPNDSMFDLAIVLAIAELLAMIYLAVMFFQKRAVVPNFIIAFLGYAVFSNVFGLIDPESYSDLPRFLASFINAAIWIPYFIVSKRVKRTFVRPGWWLVPVTKKV